MTCSADILFVRRSRLRVWFCAIIFQPPTTGRTNAPTGIQRRKNLADKVIGQAMLDEGVWAEVKVGGEHLRLFSEHNAQGVQVSVYNVRTKQWIAPSEVVDDIEDGKERAAAYAKAYLKHASLDLPPLQWKKARSQ